VIGQSDNFSLAENFLTGFSTGCRVSCYDIEDEVHGLSPRVLEFPSCERFRNRVHEGHGTAHIRGDHGVTDAGKSCREPLFTFSQRFLRAFAFGEFVEKEYKNQQEQGQAQKTAADDHI